jgi:hypothetical protein
MDHPRPFAVSALATACLVFAGIWFFWLALGHRLDVLNLLAAAAGEGGEPLAALAPLGLTRAGPIRYLFAILTVQLALVGVLVWTAYAFWQAWRSAWWCGLAFCAFSVGTALLDTIVRVFFLTLRTELVKVSPIVLDGVVILFAVNLAAAIFRPSMAGFHATTWNGESRPDRATS